VKVEAGYKYYKGFSGEPFDIETITKGAIELGKERLHPSFRHPDFLILRERRKLFSKWIQSLQGNRLRVLDVGGRIQPYRPLLEDRSEYYIAIDPQLTGLLSAVGVGEYLPFHEGSFDVVICTQTLGYCIDPAKVINEIYRVLKSGGALLLSVPAFFPRHHDERWRFLPEGLKSLLPRFSYLEVAPEGYTVAGLLRTINVCLNIFCKSRLLQKTLSSLIFPLTNAGGLMLDRFSHGNDQLAANYSVFARK
jgi:SAM-dependent methyltransferase